MSNVKTLPDHISFEEIALKWCSVGWLRAIKTDYSRFESIIRFTSKEEVAFCLQEFSCSFDGRWELKNDGVIAYLDLNNRKLIIIIQNRFNLNNARLFKPILDYIEERSHG